MSDCIHQYLDASVAIKGTGDAIRCGTLTVRCRDCGAEFGFVDAAAHLPDTLHFRIVPVSGPRVFAPTPGLLLPG